jgi:FkbM family methyltransferase
MASTPRHHAPVASTLQRVLLYESKVQKKIDSVLKKKVLANTTTKPPFSIYLYPRAMDGLRWGIYVRGRYYEDRLTQLVHWITRSSLDGIVIDAGANIGWVSLLAASHGRKVLAFEANPVTFSLLSHSIQVNPGFQDLVSAQNYGLVGEDFVESNISFVIGTSNPGASRITETHDKSVIHVPAAHLSTFVPLKNDIVLFKIDIEDAEIPVLKESMQLFSQQRVLFMHIETRFKDPSSQEVFESIFAAGYELCPGEKIRASDLIGLNTADPTTVYKVMKKQGFKGGNPNFILKVKKPNVNCYDFPKNRLHLED